MMVWRLIGSTMCLLTLYLLGFVITELPSEETLYSWMGVFLLILLFSSINLVVKGRRR